MTTPSLAVSLLLLSLLLSGAQGIRLEKGFISVAQQKNNNNLQEQETASMKRSAGPGEFNSLCKDGGECSSSGKTRKLVSKTASSAATTTTNTPSKNDKDDGGNRGDLDPKGEKVNNNTQPGGEDGDAKAKSSSVISKHQEQEAAVAHQVQHYPDLTDMTEMDYSPARRKPPIHN
ncbi:hypothetical protein PRUPE_7G256100 [Prunus persica]|uniref:Phytosulfokine-beta n=1 Tax=Prunus persica TaxID=3760 RepID=M5VS53_PRUPE|nr:uncharacterized protein LOC18771642 [Prunus persica]ONH98596.1 hypothetical protein PRUPE_7G256100 [Prunus persica]